MAFHRRAAHRQHDIFTGLRVHQAGRLGGIDRQGVADRMLRIWHTVRAGLRQENAAERRARRVVAIVDRAVDAVGRSRQVALVDDQVRKRSFFAFQDDLDGRTVIQERYPRAEVDARGCRVTVIVGDRSRQRHRAAGKVDAFVAVRIRAVGFLHRAVVRERHHAIAVDRQREHQQIARRGVALHGRAVHHQHDSFAGLRVHQAARPGGIDRQRKADRVLRIRHTVRAGHRLEKAAERRARRVVAIVNRAVDAVGRNRQVALVDDQVRKRSLLTLQDDLNRRTIVLQCQMRANINARARALIVVVRHRGRQGDKAGGHMRALANVAVLARAFVHRAQIRQRQLAGGIDGHREILRPIDRCSRILAFAADHDSVLQEQKHVISGLGIDQSGIHTRRTDRQAKGQRLLAARHIERDGQKARNRRIRQVRRGAVDDVGSRGQEALVHHQFGQRA